MWLHLLLTRDIAGLLVIGYGTSVLTNHSALYPPILSFLPSIIWTKYMYA